MFKIIKRSLDRLKLNKKFLIMYVFCFIMPLVMTDAILFRSVYETEVSNQSYYRDTAIEAYSNYLQELFAYDSKVATAIDLNKNLNSFINTPYSDSLQYYTSLNRTVDNSFFSTLSDINMDRMVIYSNNRTMLSGGYFHNLSEIRETTWYKEYLDSGVNEGVFPYSDPSPAVSSPEKDRLIYVRAMTNTKSSVTKIVTIEHKATKLSRELKDIPVNGTMYLCCGDMIVYTNNKESIDYQTLVEDASHDPYYSVKEWKLYGDAFSIYAHTDNMIITDVVKNHFAMLLIILLLTIVIPIILMKLLESSITDRIGILERAFGGENETFKPIKRITGNDEIASLMRNYNKIVDINNELTNTIYKDKLREQESDLARKNAELLALQSQINPHFLFNALESIRMHSVIKGEDETAEMVQKLAVMQRQNVEWHEDSVTIEEEEDFIDAYLQLQSYRFGDRISYNISIEEECRNILIPKLTLVTFVENACVHGIESKSTQGWIFVRVYKNGDRLTIEVEDTGDGMNERDVLALQNRMNTANIDSIKKAKHVGILNACIRIKMMFKDQARFSVESEKGIGMSVIITIPWDLAKQQNEES